MKTSVIIVEDDESMGDMLREHLTRHGYHVCWFADAASALENAAQANVDIILTDLNLVGMNGLELCERVASDRPDLPVVVITAFGTLENAVAAIRAGAYDFVTKPIDLDLLTIALTRAERHRELQIKIRVLEKALGDSRRFEGLIGESAPMQRLYTLLSRAADSDASILLTGESGTGKELVARALHNRGPRSGNPFLALNCAALPEPLLESEMFGYRRGAFTDAKRDHDGLFVAASGGTLFLDEVGEIPLTLQPKLLRALQERCVRPIGSTAEIPVDVRVIAATNLDIEAAVEARQFREDLYYRLNVIHIEVPPLRERDSDILLLATHFLNEFSSPRGRVVRGIAPAAARRLLDYPWPGNVRELRNAMERAVALASHDMVSVEDLPDKLQAPHPRSSWPIATGSRVLPTLAEMEREYLLHVLDAAGGNRSHAARILGLDRKTLYRKLRSTRPELI